MEIYVGPHFINRCRDRILGLLYLEPQEIIDNLNKNLSKGYIVPDYQYKAFYFPQEHFFIPFILNSETNNFFAKTIDQRILTKINLQKLKNVTWILYNAEEDIQ